MAARIRSLRNSITPVDEASRDDLVTTDVVTVTSLDAATTYAWSIEFAPAGSTATFSGNSAAVSPGTFTVDLVGPYLVRLTIDATLPTEDTQYVRLRALTTTLGLKLVSAGERRDETGVIPVDVSTEGWANDQNFNLQALEAAIGGGGGETLAATLVLGNTTGGTNIVISAADILQVGSSPAAAVSAAGTGRIRYNNGTLQFENSVNGGAWAAFGGGGGGTDTYTAPNEYYVDPALAVDATKRQYQTIAAALAAATTAGADPVLVRLSEEGSHAWDGSDLDTTGTTVIYSVGTASIRWALASTLSSDGVLTLKHLSSDCTTNSVAATGTATVAATLAAGDTLTIEGSPFTGVAGARTPGFYDFDASLGTVNALAAEIAAAINDPLNALFPPVTASAVGAVITITSGRSGSAGNSSTLAAATTPPGRITVSGATFSGGSDTFVVGALQTLRLEEVSGSLNIETGDPPTTGTVKSWTITRSEVSLGVRGGAVETDSLTITATESIISGNQITSLWDHSAGVAYDNFVVDAFSEVRWFRDLGAVNPPVFQVGGGGGGAVNVSFINSLFRNQASAGTTTISDGGGGFGGPVWIASRITNGGGGEFGGAGFVFGDQGSQSGLELEGFSNLPTDAPDGTRAHTSDWGQLFFKAASAGAYSQWRADGNVAHLQGSFGSGSPTTLTDVFAPYDPLVAFDVASIFDNLTIRIQGSIVITKTGPGADTAVWNVDAVLGLTDVPGGSFLYGGTPTLLYETNVGRYTVALNAVAGVGFEVVCTRTSGLENPSIRAEFYLTEGYES